jgi:hypothetical protein
VSFLGRLDKDYIAAAVVALIGAYAVIAGRSYDVGTLRVMGPGYFPVAVGLVMIGLAVLIAATAAARRPSAPPGFERRSADWRGWFCIAVSPLLFVAVGRYFGMAPAAFCCVFVAALGDRTATLRESVYLALGVTVFGVLMFGYLLNIPFPIIGWPHA